MNVRKSLALIASSSLFCSAAALAASIDMDDPRRSLGREDNVRIDAQLVSDTVSGGTPIGVTYQIQNLSTEPIAVADKLSSATYDSDTRTITFAIGAEVPTDGNMPHMIVIAPGEKKVLRTAATPAINVAAMRTAFEQSPRFVQVKVTILRDLEPFLPLIQNQRPTVQQRLSDELFEQWFEHADTIFLNAVPVSWSGRSRMSPTDVERRSMRTH
ncbi:MAG TPA: hypothetical protein VHK90_09755 [Thermoanaerobaculia bacterium]|nr:hypothetical protein [Thermoanaerobaculia bacterium]